MKKLFSLLVLSVICSLGVKAQDRLQLKTATTFLFNQYYPNEIILQNNGSTATNMNFGLGLYFACQGNGTRTYTTELKNIQTITLSENCSVEDATVFDKGSYIGISTNTTGVQRFNTAPSNGTMYSSFGFRTEVPGTIYALVKGTYKSGETRQVVLVDCTKRSNEQTDAVTLDAVTPDANYGTTYYMLKAQSVGAGIFQIHSTVGGACTVYAIKFVPDSDNRERHSYTVNLVNGMATFSSANNCSVPDGCKAYKVSAINNDNVTLETVADIPANTGVIIKANDPSTTSVEVKSITSASKKSSLLTANVAPYALPAIGNVSTKSYTNYILVKEGDDIVFAPSTGSGTVSANKAYLRVENTSAGAKSRMLFFSESTGINSIKTGINTNDSHYNIMGQKISKNHKGIIIINGRKYTNK